MTAPYLSKSKYLIGLQCPKLLWTHYHAKDQLPPVNAATQALFDEGHAVGELAKQRYPDGIDLDWEAGFKEVIRRSTELLAARRPLFEAGFAFGRAYARADILNPVGRDQWDIVEVKSGTAVKDINHHDLAFQRHCYAGAGLKIRRCLLMHVNNEYVRHGALDPAGLLIAEDVTDQVAALLPTVAGNVAAMLKVIALRQCPAPKIGLFCDDPYPCGLDYPCWSFLPEHNSVFSLYHVRKKLAFELLAKGVHTLTELPAGVRLNGKQRIQVEAVRSGAPHVDRTAIGRFLGTLKFPLHHLDFETFQTAIPRYDGTRPYQQIPFQFSLHVVESPGAPPVHHSFLADGTGDPRPALLAELERHLGDRGSIVAYNSGFEETRLAECAAAFPAYRRWAGSLKRRFVDLLAPFRAFHYHHPAQDGSNSLKRVLPALTGKGYEGLEIADGATASLEYLRITFGNANEAERRRVRQALERYCGQDTQAMIDIVRALRTLVATG